MALCSDALESLVPLHCLLETLVALETHVSLDIDLYDS
jgi:hypothetical protein